MKKRSILPVLALSVLGTESAIAGSMGPLVDATNWTGFYLGANGGAGLATAASSLNINSIPGETLTGTLPLASHELNGFLAGGQAGYNVQYRNFLLGFEGEGDWTNTQGTAPCVEILSCQAKLRWTADASARLGVLSTNDILVYVKGGVTWTGVNYTFDSLGTLGNSRLASSNLSTTKTGGLLGIGTEYLLAPRWTAKIEYNYADYGTHSNNFLITENNVILSLPVNTTLQMHAIKVGINHRIWA